MSITIADTYYLKALDLYPYDLDKVTEALNYAIGYDEDHPGANCLLGMLNMYQLGRYAEAESHFEKALAGDITYLETYYNYALLLIQTEEHVRAKKLIKYAYKVKGVNISRMKHNEGLIAEINGDLQKAKELMKHAYDRSYKKPERDYLKNELERINSKLKSKNKSSGKKGRK